jgi:hypothetical protein
MIDPFENGLTAAFQSGPERADLVEAALARADRSERRRRVVIITASLAGCAITAGAVTAAGAFSRPSLEAISIDLSVCLANPLVIGLGGAVLLAAAAGRTLWRDA